MIVSALLACTGAPEVVPAVVVTPPVVAETPVDGDVLVIALPMDPGNINPLVAPYALSGMISDLVQPGLVRRKVDDTGLSYEPNLAASWTWSDDKLALTYTLRDDAKWSDGTPVTSADAAFSWELIADPIVASNWAGTAKHIASIETPDARTIVYRFTAPKNPVLQQGYTMRGLVSKAELASADRGTLRGHPSGREPVASGPFMVSAWAPDEKIVLVPNPNAPADWKPHLSRVLVRIIPEPATRMLELHSGAVDLVMDIDPSEVPAVSADPRLSLVVQKAAGMRYIGYNLTRPMFQDKALRTALTESVNRDALMKELFSVDGVVHAQSCIGTIAPTLGPWYASDVAPLPFDPVAAGKMLDDAGWKDSDGDGVRDQNGTPLRFQLMVQTGEASLQQIAVRVQAGWKDVGVALDIDMVEPTRFSDRAHSRDYEAILWSFGANPKVDPSQEWRSDGPYNWFGYANSDVDAKIDTLVASTDLAASQAAAREMQAMIHADQPVTFLLWEDSFIAVDKRFHDVDMDTFTALRHLERWWVPKAEQKF